MYQYVTPSTNQFTGTMVAITRPAITAIYTVMIIGIYNCAHQQVNYEKDIAPILDTRCVECHTAPDGYGFLQTGLKLNSYDDLMLGTYYGPVIVAGDSQRSILNKIIEGRAGKMKSILHEQGKDLTEQEVKILQRWVDQGALNN